MEAGGIWKVVGSLDFEPSLFSVEYINPLLRCIYAQNLAFLCYVAHVHVQ